MKSINNIDCEKYQCEKCGVYDEEEVGLVNIDGEEIRVCDKCDIDGCDNDF
jgi:ribosome-binding protein aMBF1 (putative translation factor)